MVCMGCLVMTEWYFPARWAFCHPQAHETREDLSSFSSHGLKRLRLEAENVEDRRSDL